MDGANGMTSRQWLPIAGLALAAFVFNTSEFMPVGLLMDIAADFGLTEAGAGVMISVYAWAVMLLSLPLMIVASRIEFKRLLLMVVCVFSAGQFLSAAAPTYLFLVLARLVVACAHSIFWSIAAVMATRLVDARHGSFAVSAIATGSSLAMILGMPIGRAIGLMVGWRLAFAAVGTVAAAIALFQAFVFPKMPAGDPFTLRQLPGLLGNRVLMGIYATTVLFTTGYYAAYSYIEPFLQQVGGLQPSAITAVLSLYGIAGLVGSLLFSRFYDGRRMFFLLAPCLGAALAMLAMGAAVVAGGPALYAACMCWGACGTVYCIVFQAEIIAACDRDSSTVAMAMYSGLFNLGIGSGSALGGAVAANAAIGLVGSVGGALVALAFVCCALMVARPIRARRR